MPKTKLIIFMDSFILCIIFFGMHESFVQCLTTTDIIENMIANQNNKERPGLSTGTTTNVTVNMFMTDISKVDAVNMEYTINIYLRQWWTDPRLASSLLNESVTLSYKEIDRIWVPDLFFSNEHGATFHKITVPNILIRLSPGGNVVFSQRLTLTLSCYMDLIRFPMDNQTCRITMESYAYSNKEVALYWDTKTQIGRNNDLHLPEFNIQNVGHGDCTFTNPTTGSFSCLYGEIHFKRDLGYYVTQLFVPSVLIVMLSWINFWIDATAVPARVSLALLTIVTITTQNSGISARLPKVSYTKAIDVWMAVCLLFVFAGLLEYCIVNVFNRKDKEDPLYKDYDNGTDFDEVDQPEMADHSLGEMNQEAGSTFAGKKSIVTWTKSVMLKRKEEDVPYPKRFKKAWGKKWRRWARTRGMLIDVISRVLFPTLFILFNIFYWLYYVVYGESLRLESSSTPV